MKKCAYASIFAFFIISLCWTNFLAAGQIAPELSSKISGKSGADKISVVIAINNSLPASILKKELKENYSTNSERHRFGMARLKGIAGQSQSDLLASLTEMKSKEPLAYKCHHRGYCGVGIARSCRAKRYRRNIRNSHDRID
jgi:hypothetical protein